MNAITIHNRKKSNPIQSKAAVESTTILNRRRRPHWPEFGPALAPPNGGSSCNLGILQTALLVLSY